jgi:hypothetical protein
MAPPPARPAPRYVMGTWTFPRLLILAAFVLALGATLVAGGVWADGPGWLGWAALTSFFLSFLVP